MANLLKGAPVAAALSEQTSADAAALREARRILRRGGRLLISDMYSGLPEDDPAPAAEEPDAAEEPAEVEEAEEAEETGEEA